MSTSKIKSIKQLKNLKNKTVLVRCDFDVPITHESNTNQNTNQHKYLIKDDSRLRAAVPTIKYLLSKSAKVILIGHLDRPKDRDEKLSLLPVKNKIEKILERKIFFSDLNKISRLAPLARNKLGKILLLENLRFNPGEEKNDKNFAKKLAALADIYVNDAFAVSHRSAASIDAIKNYLPSYAGLNLEQEIKNLNTVMQKPKHPLVLIIGGAKIETKLPVINRFLKIADYILIGGAVANTFLKASNIKIKKSLTDDEYLEEAKKLLNLKIKNSKIILPIDFVWGNNKILDIGPKTIKLYCGIIKKAKTIIWNGPMGYFENKKFAKGTTEIAKTIFKSKARVIIGGGETGEAIKISNIKFLMSKNNNVFISTGGGAMLEFLGGKGLPGLNKIVK